MARPLRIQYPGALYHLINRGNERRAIFSDDEDRFAFLKLLDQSVDTYGVTLHCFVLMGNHWHLLVKTPLGNLAEFMRHFNISYTSYFNRRHHRTGHLYQGRYKSVLVDADSYLSMVSRYIHLNPVRTEAMRAKPVAKRLAYLLTYRWSSLPGYLEPANCFDGIDYRLVLDEFGGDNPAGRKRYFSQIREDLGGELTLDELVVGQSILGSERFIDWVREAHLDRTTDRERPDIGKIHSYRSVETVISVISQQLGKKDILQETGTTRQLAMTVLYSCAGLNNREIGEIFGVDYSTVSQGRKRFREKIKSDAYLRSAIDKVEQQLSKIKI